VQPFLISATLIALRDYDVHMHRLSIFIMSVFMSQIALGQNAYDLDMQTDDWVLTNTPEPGSKEAQLAAASKELALGHYQEAIRLTAIWIVRNKYDPLLAQAHLIHGDALFAQEYYYESLFDYEVVAREYYGTLEEIHANEKELEIAIMFANGMKKLNWGMRISDATDEAEELFIRIQERLPNHHLAETAAMELADLYFRTSQMRLANVMYLLFLENFPQASQNKTDKAEAKLVFTRLATYKGPSFTASGLLDARQELSRLERINRPLAITINSKALITRIDESLGQKLLKTAQWYLKTNKPIASEFTVRRLLQKHGDTSAAIEALEHLVPSFMPLLPPVVLEEVADFYDTYEKALLMRTPVHNIEVSK
jgi:outer membrane protein assembly factor BamD (BamD/ComL family)